MSMWDALEHWQKENGLLRSKLQEALGRIAELEAQNEKLTADCETMAGKLYIAKTVAGSERLEHAR